MPSYDTTQPYPVPTGKTFVDIVDDLQNYMIKNVEGRVTAPITQNLLKNILYTIPLSGSTNFSITSLQAYDHLRYNGSKWENSNELVVQGSSILNSGLTVASDTQLNSGLTLNSTQTVYYIQADSGITNSAQTLLTEQAIRNIWQSQNELSEMIDVNIPSPNDEDALVYNSGTNKWIAVPVYNTGQTYNKSETYNITEVYNTGETYNRTEVYNTGQTYTRNEVYNTGETYNRTEIEFLASVSGLTDSTINSIRSGYTNTSWGVPYTNYTAQDTIMYSGGTWTNRLVFDADTVVAVTQNLTNITGITNDLRNTNVNVNYLGFTDYPNSDSTGDLILHTDGYSGMTWQPSIKWYGQYGPVGEESGITHLDMTFSGDTQGSGDMIIKLNTDGIGNEPVEVFKIDKNKNISYNSSDNIII